MSETRERDCSCPATCPFHTTREPPAQCVLQRIRDIPSGALRFALPHLRLEPATADDGTDGIVRAEVRTDERERR
jgi:hypothetical protein